MKSPRVPAARSTTTDPIDPSDPSDPNGPNGPNGPTDLSDLSASTVATDSGLQAVADDRQRARRGPSLRGRALRFLARREHSRAELRGKLIGPEVDPVALDALLNDLEANRFLSDRRYAEIMARSKGMRHGVATLARTLSQQGVSPDVAAEALAPLHATERERGLEIWRRRFGKAPADIRERARQHRFLLGRGFDPATVFWVLKQAAKAHEP